MMKVATLSFQHAYNYGAVFQVAALQHIIESLGVDCDIIDYRCPAIDRQYDFKPIGFNKSLFRNLRANLVLAPFIRGKKKNFQHWMDTYKRTEVITDKEQLKALNNRYDKFVVGSDQVWNLKCQGYDEAFFLDFVSDNSKKVAYAASFGTYNVKKEDRGYYERSINKFKHISVRENRGIELVKEIAGKDSIACMDPVLLAGRDFWESKKDKSFKTSEKYIFVYQLGHGSTVPKFVKKLKEETGLTIYFATGHIGNMIYYSVGDKNVSTISPERFLSLISDAEYVVTNSFHASVLSILFERKFFVVAEGGEKATYNSRIYNLLSDYNLKDRITENFDKILLLADINYTVVKELLEKASCKSISFFKSFLNS